MAFQSRLKIFFTAHKVSEGTLRQGQGGRNKMS